MATDTREDLAMTMTREQYLAHLHRPGAFQSATWQSDVKPAAAYRGTALRKVTTATIRTGIDYGNTAAVAALARETGPLPWGEWAVPGLVITHNGQDYVRLYVTPDTIRTRYYVDGHETDRDTFGQYLTPSQRKASPPTAGCLTVKLAGIVSLS